MITNLLLISLCTTKKQRRPKRRHILCIKATRCGHDTGQICMSSPAAREFADFLMTMAPSSPQHCLTYCLMKRLNSTRPGELPTGASAICSSTASGGTALTCTPVPSKPAFPSKAPTGPTNDLTTGQTTPTPDGLNPPTPQTSATYRHCRRAAAKCCRIAVKALDLTIKHDHRTNGTTNLDPQGKLIIAIENASKHRRAALTVDEISTCLLCLAQRRCC